MPLTREFILRSKAFQWLAAFAYATSVLWLNMLWFGILLAPGTDTPPPDAGLPIAVILISLVVIGLSLIVFSPIVIKNYSYSERVNKFITVVICIFALFIFIFMGYFVFGTIGHLIEDFNYVYLLFEIIGLSALSGAPILLLRMSLAISPPVETARSNTAS